MAAGSKKDRLIEEAQKLALRGQLDKAVKIYEQVMELDPSATGIRQKMAELLVKAGRNDAACTELATIGKSFAKNGFLLKAIAVYKQIQKLTPDDVTVSLTLAELNEKHGLTANALSEYKHVYDYYEKNGSSPEALKILDRMQNVDPNNVSIRLKLAEAYIQQGRAEDAYTLFSKIALQLQERGDTVSLTRLDTRVRQLFPEKAAFMLEVLAGQISSGNAAAAVNSLQNLLRSDPTNKGVWDLTITAYKRMDQPQRVRIAYQHYLRYFPTDPEPMLGLINCAIEAHETGTALELLGSYEESLLSAGRCGDLDKIYRALENSEPVNSTVLEGRIKIARHAGDEQEATSLTSRLRQLQGAADDGLTDAAHGFSGEVQPDPEFIDFPEDPVATATESPEDSPDEESAEVSGFENTADAADVFDSLDEQQATNDDEEIEIEIEIDIDIDIDADFDRPDAETSSEAPAEEWLESVGDMFETISNAPGSVKFGSEMDASDAQSHFDLGLAFREMGLFDEAINEFRTASHEPTRRLECLLMQAVCIRERGNCDTAITMLQTLLKPGLNIEDLSSVKYELVLTFEAAGMGDRATQLLNEIYEANPGFRDVSSKLTAANLGESLDFSDEDLDGFDLK